MKRKSIIVRIPQDCKDIRIVKEYVLDDNITIQIVVEDTFEENDTAARDDSRVFLCYQDRTRTRFNPYAYSYIEAVGGHNFRWMPADNKNPSIVMSIKSLDNLLSQLHKCGVINFLKVHASYAVNTDHIGITRMVISSSEVAKDVFLYQTATRNMLIRIS